VQLGIRGALLLLTHSCNLRCDYCFDQNQRNRPDLSEDMALAAIDWCLEQAAGERVHLGLFGGEPLARADLIEWLLPRARERAGPRGKRISFSIATNATLLTEPMAATLQRHRVTIQLSADGIQPAQDAHRRFASGRGSFAVVDSKCRLILDACPKAAVRMTVTPRNVRHMAESVAYYLEAGFRKVSPMPVYEEGWSDADLRIYGEQADLAGAILVREILAGRLDLEIGGFSDRIRAFGRPQARGRACGAGFSMVAIDTDGSIYPCHRFIGYTDRASAYRLGHVATGVDAPDDPLHGLRLADVKFDDADRGVHDEPPSHGARPFSACAAMNVATTGAPLLAPPIYERFEEIREATVRSVVAYMLDTNPQALEAYVQAGPSSSAGRGGGTSALPYGVSRRKARAGSDVMTAEALRVNTEVARRHE